MSLVLGIALGLFLFCLLWLNLLSLPANWLILGVLCLLAWMAPISGLNWAFVGLMAGVALMGEVFEFAAQWIGGKRGGASRAGNFGGVVGSILGALFGAPFGFGLGAVVGALAGAWLGCFAVERMQESSSRAASAAWGAFWGRSLGLVGKSAAGAAIIVMTVSKIIGQAA